MSKIRLILAVLVCKLLVIIGKLMGTKSSAAPGMYASKICPSILPLLAKQVRCGIVAVCGTNGKTTTNNIIYKILTDKGYKVVCNNIGANMMGGVITAFVEKTNLFGKLDCDYATLEMDEAFSVKIFEKLTPDVTVITNLFKDQLDRYGEVELTAGYLKNALSLAPKTRLVINGDDPVLYKIALNHSNFISYGVKEKVEEDIETGFCPECAKELKYNYHHYSDLGNYYCENCDFKHPGYNFYATNVKLSDGIDFVLNDSTNIKVEYRGFYNVFNILAALSAVDALGVGISDVEKSLIDYKPQIGRMESFNLKKQVILNLAKNPAGFNQAIKTVLSDSRRKDIVLAVNDCESDGKDISWLWDVNTETLNDENIGKIGLCGMRKDELNLRLKYGETDKEILIFDSIGDCVNALINTDSEVLYLLVNYTMIFESQKLLKKMEGEMK